MVQLHSDGGPDLEARVDVVSEPPEKVNDGGGGSGGGPWAVASVRQQPQQTLSPRQRGASLDGGTLTTIHEVLERNSQSSSQVCVLPK